MGKRWDDYTEGPMGGYLRTHPVNVAVRKGQRVPDPADAELAVAEARWLERRTRWNRWSYIALGVFLLCVGIVSNHWWLLFALAAVVGCAVDHQRRRRILRSIPLNEALLNEAHPTV
jgi:hypothetical protein